MFILLITNEIDKKAIIKKDKKTIPKDLKLDLRPKCPPVYNQGSLGVCTMNSNAFLYEYYCKNVLKSDFVPSRFFMDYMCANVDGGEYDIGIDTFSVSASEHQQWYYYPGMTPDDVLVFKSYDSDGVIGRTCPHASFAHPNPLGELRRSIELRVLCFC